MAVFTACPSERELRDFHAGRLNVAALHQLESHLSECSTCETQLLRLDTAPDELVAALRNTQAYTPPAVPTELPVIPGYELLGVIGRGGMGVVYQARQLGLDRIVALKMVHGGAFADPAAFDRLRREAMAAAALRHANIVQVFDVGEHGGLAYLAMEFINGGSLDRATAGRPLPPRDTAQIVAAIARGVQHAHDHGIIHRDLKPANVLMQNEGGRMKDDLLSMGRNSSVILHSSSLLPKVADFGLARRLDDARLTTTGTVLGSPSYMAPEQTFGDHAVGPLADVYALGAILYELLTGRPPITGDNAADTLLRVREDEPMPPRRIRPEVPRDLETICLKCLRKPMADRYVSAAALADDLVRFLDGRPITARRTSPVRVAWLWAKRRPVLAASLALVQTALIVIAIGIAYYNRQLNTALAKTSQAEQQAAANADAAMTALDKLVFEVQDTLRAAPATRPIRAKILEAAIDGLHKVAAAGDPNSPQLSRAAAYAQIGQLYSNLGRFNEALDASRKAHAAAGAVLQIRPENVEARFYWADSIRHIGHATFNADKPAEARAEFTTMVDTMTPWIDAAADKRLRWTYLLGWEGRAHSAQWMHDFATATKDYESMLAAAERWRTDAPTLFGPITGIARANHFLGTVALDRKELARAATYFEGSLAAYRQLLQQQPNSDIQLRGMKANLSNLAEVRLQLRDVAGARAANAESLVLARQLTARDGSLDNKLQLIDTLYMAGRIELEAKQPKVAEPLLRESQSLLETLAKAGHLSGRAVYQNERPRQLAEALSKCQPGGLDGNDTESGAGGGWISQASTVESRLPAKS